MRQVAGAGEAERSEERGQGANRCCCWQTMPQGIGAISAQLIDLRHFLSGQSTGEEQQEEQQGEYGREAG